MSQITEARLYEAFGLTPEGEGGKEQGAAAPAAETQQQDPTEGAREQDVAEPASVETSTGDGEQTEPAAESGDPEEPENKADTPAGEGKKTQTPETRHANAARRRQQEQQAAIDAALRDQQAKHDADLKALLTRLGLKDPVTGNPIETMDQFRNWQQREEDNQIAQELKAGKLSKDTLEKIISAHPAVRKAEQLADQAEASRKQQESEEGKARIQSDMEKIAELNPQIEKLTDILAMPTAPQFREYVDKGYSFLDAYKLANMDAIAQDKAQRARQAAQTAARGKDHLVATGNSRGNGAASVPSSQMELFRRMNPKASDAEIQKFYNKYLSRQGG